MAQLTVADDEVQLARLAAERVTELIVQAVDTRGRAFVALAGGTTPRRLYLNLADPRQPWRDRIPWQQVHLFWGDERHVPPDHPDSNYGMAKAALIDNVPIPADHVHRIHAELPDAREAALDYEGTINHFDLMLLGLGEDAHIASIFPGSELLADAGPVSDVGRPFTGRHVVSDVERPFTGRHVVSDVGRPFTGRHVAAVWAPHLRIWRITLTPDAILDSAKILVLVAGSNKATAVHAALEGALDEHTSPAQLLRAAGDRVEWFVDRAAASRL